MLIFAQEYLWTLATLIGLGLAGGFAIAPFRSTITFPWLAAPLAGLLIFTLGVAIFYSLAATSVATSMLLMGTLTIGTTILTLFNIRSELKLPNLTTLSIVAIFIGFVVYITNYTSIKFSAPGFLFYDGSDQLGYAHVSDWLLNHRAWQAPILDPTLPYQSWLAFMYDVANARFGSIFTLAELTILHGRDSMFTYNSACGVILAASYLGISAIFTRYNKVFLLLLIGLLTTIWYDYSISGFFGKILAYPSIFFIVGIFLTSKRPMNIRMIAVLAVLTASCAIMHFAISIAIFITIPCGLWILFSILFAKTNNEKYFSANRLDDLAVLALLIGVAVAAGGFLVKFHPMFGAGTFPAFPMTWAELLPRTVELDSAGPLYSKYSLSRLMINFVIVSIFTITLLCIAFIKKEKTATTLLLFPILLFLSMIHASSVWPLYQMIGIFYPAILLGAFTLAQNTYHPTTPKQSKLFYVILVLTTVIIYLHIPRLIGAVKRYASSDTLSTQQFSLTDINTITEMIGKNKVTINIKDINGLPLLVELGKTSVEGKELALQWTPEAWRAIVGYRNWTPPKIDPHTHLRIESITVKPNKNCVIQYKTPQYQLLNCHPK